MKFEKLHTIRQMVALKPDELDFFTFFGEGVGPEALKRLEEETAWYNQEYFDFLSEFNGIEVYALKVYGLPVVEKSPFFPDLFDLRRRYEDLDLSRAFPFAKGADSACFFLDKEGRVFSEYICEETLIANNFAEFIDNVLLGDGFIEILSNGEVDEEIELIPFLREMGWTRY